MFNRLRIATKLAIGFGAILTLVAVLALAAGLSGFRSKAELSEFAGHKDNEVLDQRVGKRIEQARTQMWIALATGDTTHWSNADTSMQIAENMLGDLAEATRDPARQAQIKQWGALIDNYKDLATRLQALHGQNAALGTAQGKQLTTIATTVGAELANVGEALSRDYDKAAKATQSGAERGAELLAYFAAGMATAAMLVGFGLAYWITRGIRRPIVELTNVMSDLARGDLEVEIPGATQRNEVGEMARSVEIFKRDAIERSRIEKDSAAHRADAETTRERAAAERARAAEAQAETVRRLGGALETLAAGDLTVRLDEGFVEEYARVRDDFNEAIDRLKQTMRAVVTSTTAIHSGTREISDASDDLARRMEQQAASLDATGAALNEITATVTKSAEGARRARAVVDAADQDAKTGAGVARQAIRAMDAIAKSSDQIGQIIGVIDEIAFQTNLLALNAGVEAARAGDAGRGFAVVASEVRALAQRSAEAAKEIKGLISTSSDQVREGVALVVETGAALERILEQATRINLVVAELATSAKQQAVGLEQVSGAINQMDHVTKQNVEMVGKSAAASRSLSRETSQLSSLIAQFRVGDAAGSGEETLAERAGSRPRRPKAA
jgi:methyl-accepting chemotaxis protein